MPLNIILEQQRVYVLEMLLTEAKERLSIAEREVVSLNHSSASAAGSEECQSLVLNVLGTMVEGWVPLKNLVCEIRVGRKIELWTKWGADVVYGSLQNLEQAGLLELSFPVQGCKKLRITGRGQAVRKQGTILSAEQIY